MRPKEPHIYTKRAVVRLATRNDRENIISYYMDNRDRISPVSPTWPEDFFTKKFWNRQIDRNLDEFYGDISVRMFIFDRSKRRDPAVLGNISLSGILRGAAQFCYLGYGVAREWEGQGLMTETVSAVVQYAFDELNMHRVMANYRPTNERSGKLLQRLGFVVEGYARDYLYLDGTWQDHIMATTVNPKWKVGAWRR
jgi:ribosomal-protein-alanine N-acetyltransferase